MRLDHWFAIAGQPFSFYPGLTRTLGISTNAVVLLCLIGWRSKPDTDGWVPLTGEEIENETGLSKRERASARKELVDKMVVAERYERLNHQMFFRVENLEMVLPEVPKGDLGKCQKGTSSNYKEIVPLPLKEMELGLVPKPTVQPWSPTPEQVRLGTLFKRRASTRWDGDEVKAFKAISPVVEEDLAAVEKFYGLSESPDRPLFRRTSLLVLLRHWNGEVDKSRRHQPKREYNL